MKKTKNGEFVEATISNAVAGLKKGDKVMVNALDYTTKGNDEEVEIDNSGKKMMIVKKYLEVKI